MKKTLLIAIIALLAAGPAFADGSHKKSPKSNSESDCGPCKLIRGIGWVIKLPIRVVTSTTVGLYDLVTDQTFDGFVDGYKIIK